MSMSDCVKCWDTPCTCGYEYRKYSKKYRVQQASVVLGISENSKEYELLTSITPKDHPKKDEI